MQKEEILKALAGVKYPPYSRDIVSFGMVKYVKISGSFAEIGIFTGGDETLALRIIKEASELLHSKFPGSKFEVSLLKEDPSKKEAPKPKSGTLSETKIKIAVASGKGGVGKSTVAVNLARAMARIFSSGEQARVGLMDCDIHGPSATMLFGQKVYPSVSPDEKIIPPQIGGVKTISMGMLVSDEQPLLWRGPMVTSAIRQFAEEVLWGELDAMVLDLPPGTGDAVLSVVQTVPLSGAIIVTTPNSLAAATALRGANVFGKSGVKILGVVNNMAFLEMPDGSKNFIFGEKSASETADKLGVPIIAEIPIDKTLQEAESSEKSKKIFDGLARKILDILSPS